MKTPKLHIGTAGWSYKDWVPAFYPKNQSANFDWLQFYAHYFNFVEVNSSYYTYLNPMVVESWLRKLEDVDDFSFTLKLHQDFTHKHNFTKAKVSAVLQNLNLLKDSERLSGLLIQFPYSFQFNVANMNYMQKIIELFDGYNRFVEVRHKSWQTKKAKSITFCTVDQPNIGESIEFNPFVGNKAMYIRFHGRNEEAWINSLSNFGKKQTYEEQSSRYEYLYLPGELVSFNRQIKEVYDQVKDIYIVMNNHPKGNAVANAFELLHLLKDREKIILPETIVKAYSRLKAIQKN
ncbi:MAG: DUF72 domain-containing protein [Bacteroidetes bacterium]|nr:DUF72 domain-containing protein [Bacteroidota bacterium]MBU1796833.1 DUF72 domain-containing protein [Bacteroidota bacterium]